MAEQQITENMIAQAMMKVMGQANGLMNSTPAQQPMMPAAMSAPQPQQMAGFPNPSGWSVPIETDLGGVTVTVYVQFPPQTFPQYQQIIATMMSMGYNIRAYQKSNGYSGNQGGSNWGNRGSWGNRGGYQGRGGWGRY